MGLAELLDFTLVFGKHISVAFSLSLSFYFIVFGSSQISTATKHARNKAKSETANVCVSVWKSPSAGMDALSREGRHRDQVEPLKLDVFSEDWVDRQPGSPQLMSFLGWQKYGPETEPAIFGAAQIRPM